MNREFASVIMTAVISVLDHYKVRHTADTAIAVCQLSLGYRRN